MSSPKALKFEGLLHDPVDKAICIVGGASHPSRACEIAKNLVQGIPNNVLLEIRDHHRRVVSISPADWNASAANRGLIPHGTSVHMLSLQNPFSGVLITIKRLQEISRRSQQIPVLPPANQFKLIGIFPREYNNVFWNLMFEYYRVYSMLSIPIAQSIFLLPEDTRIPSSPIISHLAMTSALSGCPENFYLVYVEVGGVQEFISSARKTADLWAGSYIYSLLLANVIKYFVEEFGPDSVLIPWILGVPLIDVLVFGGSFYEDALLPLIPNTITAIICLEKTNPESLRAEIREKLEHTWESIVDSYIKYLQSKLSNISLDKRIIKESLKFNKVFTKVRIALLGYTKASASNINSVLNQIGSYQQIRQIPTRKCSPTCRGCNTYNDHLEYPHQSLENFENYIKILQLGSEYSKYSIKFSTSPEEFSPTEKTCLACGSSRQARFSDDPNTNEQAWKMLEKNHIVDSGERLCHICLLKRTLRFFIHEIFNLNERIGFLIPSTSDIGAVWFKVSMLAIILGLLKSTDISKKDKIKVFNEVRGLIEELATKLEELAKYLKDFGLEKKIEECKGVPPRGIITWLYEELKKDDIIREVASEDGETPENYLDSIGIRTIICAPGELFECEGLRALLLRKDLAGIKDQAENLIDDIKELLEKWRRFVVNNITEKVLLEAKKVIAKTIASILAKNDENYCSLYYDILNKIYSSLSCNLDDRDQDFANIIPIAVVPQDSLRFCIIRADGDSIGKWINGEMRVPWILMHHPQIIPQIQKLRNISGQILLRKSPTSPAYLSTLSMTLSYNALLIARIIDAFGGFLIYTGGDDVLAMIPPEVWHLVYLLLRFTFSCEIILNRALERFNYGIYSYGMSWRATQSYGIVIAHHKADFRWAIEVSRDLEERSKDFSSENRPQKDAISVALLSRGAITSETEPLPNLLISHDGKLWTIREFDEHVIKQISQNVMQSDVMNRYNELTKQILTSVFSATLGNDFAFIGIIPKVHSIATNEPTIISLPMFAYRVACMVLTGELSRAGLYILQEFYDRFRDLKKQEPTDAQLQILKYQLERKVQQERLRKVIAGDLVSSTKVLIELSKKFSSNFLSVYFLAEIIRRCLSNCIIG